MTETRRNSYSERISRVCEYINQNLDDSNLSSQYLSDVAAFSKFHFHRVFSVYTGMSVTKFALLARLKRASYRLAFEKGMKVIDIALEAGFQSPEAFTRAFRRTFDQSPTEFRATPLWPQWHQRFQLKIEPYGEKNMNIEIVEFEAAKVALLEHLGPPDRVLETAAKFIDWRKESGLSPVKTSKTYGIPYSDPNNTEPSEFRWDVCGSIDGEVPSNKYGVKLGEIPGGRCVVFRHKGKHDNVNKDICTVYREWLPEHGEEPRDYPCFFDYLNLIHEVNECDLLTDVYIPIV